MAHRRTPTNEALVNAARAWGLESAVLDPQRALATLGPGDIALARLDVRETLDGIERGTGELEQLAAGGIEVLNPPSALVSAHDKLLTSRLLRLAGLPHPHTSLLAPGLPAAAPELPVVLKPRFGSWGRGIVRCETGEELERGLLRVHRTEWFREQGVLVQELIEPIRSDLRIVVAGGRVIGVI